MEVARLPQLFSEDFLVASLNTVANLCAKGEESIATTNTTNLVQQANKQEQQHQQEQVPWQEL